MSDNPLVTVIVPAYNGEQYIEDTLKSAATQLYDNIEVIVIDDGSTDATAQCVKPFLSDSRFRYIYQANAGVSVARNTGILAGSGEWVAMLDSDDLWMPDKLQRQVDLIASNSDVSLVFANGIEFNEHGDIGPFYRDRRKFPDGDIFCRLLDRNCLWTSSVMVRRQDLLDIGMFNAKSTADEDYDVWIRILQRGGLTCGVWEPVVRYRIRIDSSSCNKIAGYAGLVSMFSKVMTASTDRRHVQIARRSLAKAKSDLLLSRARSVLISGGSRRELCRLIFLAWCAFPERCKPLGWIAQIMVGMSACVGKSLARRW
ncbi:MAG: glycosyltransferase family A protein [Armatimonadota bacterium]|nr:glycosyltransferase family 2 protein [bacterium]